MNPLDPQDWWGLPPWLDPDESRRRSRSDQNREAVERWMSLAMLCLCFAVLSPAALMPIAFAVLMGVTGSGLAAFAYWRRDSLFAPHLTAWDEAALSLAVAFGLIASWHIGLV
jgi:hypothetical protein